MMKPLTIKLSPHDAVVLASFHNEYMADIINCLPETASLKQAMENFLQQVSVAMPEDGLEDADAEVEVNILLGKAPERPGKR